MGTDIHGRLHSRWANHKPWWDVREIDNSRNYRLFATLAGVRNGYSVAGIPTHKPITPISEPRGLPDDLPETWFCPYHGFHNEDKVDCDFSCIYGDHSYSWLTLDEIRFWEGWDQTLQETGWLNREQYVEWELTGKTTPDSWCGWIAGAEVVYADHDTGVFPLGWTHVSVSWERPLRDSCKVFLAWVEYAHALTRGCQEARIVFGFDS